MELHCKWVTCSFTLERSLKIGSDTPILSIYEFMGFFVWKSQRIHDKNIHLYVGYSEKGIGNIPNAVLRSLINHKDLGIHSEMFSDGVIDLIEAGCITNSHKKILPGQIVGSFCLGSRRLYDFLDNNPFIGKIAFHT